LASAAAAVPSGQPIQVAIVRAPDAGSDWDLAIATWALALGTVGLCVITGLGVRKQGRDMLRSVEAAEASAAAAGKSATAAADAVEAAARQRRDDLERAVNVAAHRVITTAARVNELAKEIPASAKALFALAGHHDVVAKAAPYERDMKLRQEAATEAVTAGSILLGTLERKPSDAELTGGLRDMDRRLVAVEMMKEDITRKLESLNSQIEFHREQNAARTAKSAVFAPP